MFDTTDPRAALGTAPTVTPRNHTDPTPAPRQLFVLPQLEPDEVTTAGSATWIVRGANFVVAVTRAIPGDSFDVAETGGDESVVVLADERGRWEIFSAGTSVAIDRPAVVTVPEGAFRVTARSACEFVRIFSAGATDLLAAARNHAAYASPRPELAPPPPTDRAGAARGLRVHPIDDIRPTPGRFGRIFRSDALMVNLLDVEQAPRDPNRLSPHVHDDFEQCSVTFEGDYVHHLRTPWTPRLPDWREDEHVLVTSPSVTIIPPRVVHTTQSIGPGRHSMMDIFAPPRADFLAMDGWVLNAEDYQAR